MNGNGSHGEQEPAADERRAERGPAQDVLDALGAAEVVVRHEVEVEAAVGRLVDVVREEEAEERERRRLECRHEGKQREETAMGTSASTMNGRRRPSGRWVASLIGPTKSGMKKAKTLRGQDEPDERGRVGELAEDRAEGRRPPW